MTNTPGKSPKSMFPIKPEVLDVKPSATLAINEKSKILVREGNRIYRLGFGQSPFPVPGSVVRSLQENAHRKEYLPVKGLGELRASVASFHQRLHGVSAETDDIFIGPGSKELMFLLQLIWNGSVLIPSPSWVSYEPQARLLGNEAVWLNTRFSNDWLLQPDELVRICRQNPSESFLLILNYPSNPTGATFSGDMLEELAKIAREYNVLILSDEIYGELDHSGKHRSIARYYPEGTILSGGLSKWCGAGGWRLGTFCFPKELRWMSDLMGKIASETFSAVSAPVQYAAVTAFNMNDEIDSYLSRSRSILASLGNSVAMSLEKMGVRTVKPFGGFYLFPDFSGHRDALALRGITSSNQFCEKLLFETGVALLPGTDFGRPEGELTCRLAYVDFDGGKCLEDLGEHEEPDALFLRKNCGNVIKAVELFEEWLKS